jgi:hypothetical protein
VDCAGKECIAACWPGQSCDGAIAPFTDTGKCGDPGFDCACYAAMAPSTASLSSTVEGPGFELSYSNSNGSFEFTKRRTLMPEVNRTDYGMEVQPVWGDIFVGQGWKLEVLAPQGSTVRGNPCPENTVSQINVADPLNPTVSWMGDWTQCEYPAGSVNASDHTVHWPRGFLTEIPTWPWEPPLGFEYLIYLPVVSK